MITIVKKETEVCDICEKNLGEHECVVCDKKLCNECSRNMDWPLFEVRYYIGLYKKICLETKKKCEPIHFCETHIKEYEKEIEKLTDLNEIIQKLTDKYYNVIKEELVQMLKISHGDNNEKEK